MQHLNFIDQLSKIESKLKEIEYFAVLGKILSIKGNKIEAIGVKQYLFIGSKCELVDQVTCISALLEVIGFEEEKIILMSLENLDGISLHSPRIKVSKKYNNSNYIYPDSSWLGRVINGFGDALDGSSLGQGSIPYKLKASPPNSMKRHPLGQKLETGIKAIDCFVNCCIGQKLGILAPSGTGKSVLVSMLAKYSRTDVKVIGLIGERSKEVQEFINHYLTPEDMQNTVIIVATSDQSALTKINATYLTIAVSEYFRDEGNEVLCIIDSMTRFATAQREVGLTLGEYPTSGGYTASVFNNIPKILERAGPGENNCSITAFFTVLEEEENDVIGEILKSFLDGHIILDRKISQRSRFPAIDIMKSISRAMPACNSEEEIYQINLAKGFVAKYQEVEDLLHLGVYHKNSNQEVDNAIKYFCKIEKFLSQKIGERYSLNHSFYELKSVLDIK